METCPNCHNPVEPGAAFCDHCGHRLTSTAPPSVSSLPPTLPSVAAPTASHPGETPAMITCQTCGTANLPGTAFCDNCGSWMTPPTRTDRPSSKPLPATVLDLPTFLPSGPFNTVLDPTKPRELSQAPPPVSAPENETKRRPGPWPAPQEEQTTPAALGAGLQYFPTDQRTKPAREQTPIPPTPPSPPPAPPSAPPVVPLPAREPLPATYPPPPAPPSAPPVAPPPAPEPLPTVYAPPPAPVYVPPPAYVAPSSNTLIGRFELVSNGAIISMPSGKTTAVLGREDPVSEAYPEVDLSLYNAEKDGVSRLHARLTLLDGQMHVEDLHSTNYTFLNNQKLTPGQRYPVGPGDELRLGRLKLRYLL